MAKQNPPVELMAIYSRPAVQQTALPNANVGCLASNALSSVTFFQVS